MRSGLGKGGLPPQRRVHVGSSVTASAEESASASGGEGGSDVMPAGERALLALGYRRDSHRQWHLDERERERMLARVPEHWRVPGRPSAEPGAAACGGEVA